MKSALRFSPLLGAALLVVACNDGANDDSDAALLDDVDVANDVAEDAPRELITREDTAPEPDIAPVACDDEDRLAPNDTFDTAHVVVDGSLRSSNLFLCSGTEDWFAVDVRAGQVVEADIAFSDRIGDLALYAVAAGDTSIDEPIAASLSRDDEEAIRFTAETDGVHYIVVAASDRAGGAYEMTITAACRGPEDCADDRFCSFVEQYCVAPIAPACGDDRNEPNNHSDQATPITVEGDGFAFEHNLTVCEDDDDYFSLTLDEPSTVSLEIQSDPGFRVDLYMVDAAGRRVTALDDEEANPKTETLRALAAGTYTLVVDHFVTALGDNVTYNLTVEVQPERCEDSRTCGEGGRALCQDGACVSYEPESPNAAGGQCDDRSDCAGDLGCYEGEQGFDDNFCSRNCENNDECADFDDGYCLSLGRSGVCFEACSTDTDCPEFYSCNDDARCRAVECDLDADCNEGQRCRRSEQLNQGYCTSAPFQQCGDDDYEDNDTDSAAVPVNAPIDAVICDDDDDWYSVVVAEDGTELEVTVAFEGTVDLDVFILDAAGLTVGDGTQPDANPEVGRARYLAAGTYWVRVNQFPLDGNAVETPYTLSTRQSESTCTADGNECLALDPLRVVCDEVGGACGFLDGAGEVPLGATCDSNDDCVSEAAFCWTFESATSGRNICTNRCSTDDDCAEVTGTSCVAFQGGFAACLPS